MQIPRGVGKLDIFQDKVADHLILKDLNSCEVGNPDVIVEVAHPDISKQYGQLFLKVNMKDFEVMLLPSPY